MAQGFKVGDWSVAPELNSLEREGRTVHLEPKVMQVLLALAEHPGEVVSKEKLMHRVWAETFVTDEVLTRSISELRKAFDDNPREPIYIQTIAKGGYRLVAPVMASSPTQLRHRLLRPVMISAAAFLAMLLLLAVNVGGWRDRLLGRERATPTIHSVVVLSLENLSRDPEQEYFSDGMTEALAADLSKISNLRVISRTSAMHYKGTKKPLVQIARELGVDGVIEGTVFREGQQVRITVQLIHGATDQQLWAESYQRELRGILALQSEVARTIARQVKAQVTPQEQERLASAQLVNPEAYQLYLQGRYFLVSVGREDIFRKAAQYFEESLAKDPNYAPTHAALAFTYAQLAFYGYDPPLVGYPRARTTVVKALELDEKLAEAHATLGDIKLLFDWDWSGAGKEDQRALELNPSSPDAHDEYGFYLTLMGRFDAGIAEISKAQELDRVPVQRTVNMGWCNLMARRYDAAISHLKKALELDQYYPPAHMEMASAYARKGMRAEAEAEYERTRSLTPAGKDLLLDAWLAPVYVLQGKRSEGLKLADWWRQESTRRHVDFYLLAALYAQLGVNERALDALEKGFQQRSPLMVELKVDPWLDSLRSDPRFQDIVRRVGLPP